MQSIHNKNTEKIDLFLDKIGSLSLPHHEYKWITHSNVYPIVQRDSPAHIFYPSQHPKCLLKKITCLVFIAEENVIKYGILESIPFIGSIESIFLLPFLHILMT